jgi:hypothetical protein
MSHVISESPRAKRCAFLPVLCLGGLILFAGGCATFQIPTPENFAKRASTRTSFSALTAEEEKLLVRHFTVLEKQDIKFWTEAARNNLVQERGYTLIENGEFKTDGGVVGHRFLFELSMGDVPYRYLLVVFSTQSRIFWFWKRQHIYTAEFLCEKKNYDKHSPAVEKALKQFAPRRGKAMTRTGVTIARASIVGRWASGRSPATSPAARNRRVA